MAAPKQARRGARQPSRTAGSAAKASPGAVNPAAKPSPPAAATGAKPSPRTAAAGAKSSPRTAGSGAKPSPRAAGSGAKPKDKGTKGGRPDPQSAAPAARAGNGQGRGGGGQARNGPRQGGQLAVRPGRPVQPARAPQDAGDGRPRAPLWLQLTTLVLSLAGLGVSVYLTIAHFTSSAILACSDNGLINCAAVTTSPESEVFGIFPVAVLGLAFYVFLVAINTPWAWRAKWPVIGYARIGSLAVGMVFVLYLVYTELVTLGEICLWCTSVHVITFLLFALTMFAFAAGYGLNKARSTY